MNPSLLKLIYKPTVKTALRHSLRRQNRNQNKPKIGGFNRGDINDILDEVWRCFDRLAPEAPCEPTAGNRVNMMLACLTLSLFEVMLAAGVERRYMFKTYPFNTPGYIYERVTTAEGVFFAVFRCPLADYFRVHDATDLCVSTWCNRSHELAEMWGGELERIWTIAGGHDRCDFHFKATHSIEGNLV
jgi:hypothetical protein